MICITSKKAGFRRAGMAHSGTVEYPDGHFSEAQLAMLLAEPMLVVTIVEDDPAEKSPKKLKEK